MSKWISGVLVFVLQSVVVQAQSTNTSTAKTTSPKSEFVRICQQYVRDRDLFRVKLGAIGDPVERNKFWSENDPIAAFSNKALEFELNHRGSHSGYLALRTLIVSGGEYIGPPDIPPNVARRKALGLIGNYADADLLPELMNHALFGNFEPEWEGALRGIMESPKTSKRNRDFARYSFALWALGTRDARETYENQLSQNRLDPGSIHDRLARMPERDRIMELVQESRDNLKALIDENSQSRKLAIDSSDRDRYFVQPKTDDSEKGTTASELARSLLFQEDHLRNDCPSPDLELKLVSGESWSLAKQRGKTVIIMFSYTGCGPCEQMYPKLREMQKEHPNSLSIVGIMADESRQDAIDAIESGKMTWNVYWDGNPGTIARKWSVHGFPTIYVVDRQGLIAAKNLRGKALRSKIDQLTR